MYDILIKQARLVSDIEVDIAIQDGKIAEIGKIESQQANKVIDLKGRCYVSAGWIDLHTHCYPNSPIYHDTPDKVGIETGVTCVVDAGSVGANDIDDFYQLAQLQKTQVYSLLNISKIGLLRQNELADIEDINFELIKQSVEKYPQFIRGYKARMSGSVVEESGIEPLKRAKKIQSEVKHLPLMVHIGNTPPKIEEVLNLLEAGDVVTHCYNGKPNQIFANNQTLKPCVQSAMDRGVLLDVGHGSASFSFKVAALAIEQGIYPNTISSDIYCKNRELGPVKNLAHIMTKFLAIGMSISQVIECVTENAAKVLNLAQKGRLSADYDADLTFFTVDQQAQDLVDSDGMNMKGVRSFKPLAAMIQGELFLTQDGVQSNVFSS